MCRVTCPPRSCPAFQGEPPKWGLPEGLELLDTMLTENWEGVSLPKEFKRKWKSLRQLMKDKRGTVRGLCDGCHRLAVYFPLWCLAF